MIEYVAKGKLTFHQLSLAAVALALHHREDSHDMIFRAPYFNRQSDADMQITGLFLEPLPVRISYQCLASRNSADSTIDIAMTARKPSFLQHVRESSQAALSHAVPWTELLVHLNIQPELPNHPLFDVIVSFHDERRNTDPFLVPGAETLYTRTEGAKFNIIVEFLAITDDMSLLRMKYVPDCFGMQKVRVLQKLVAGALRVLMSGTDYDGLKEAMRRVHGNEDEGLERSDFFGVKLSCVWLSKLRRCHQFLRLLASATL
ncbi:MAG: hypothetical protein Q9225_006315 [Loekoesia sp. 1 TL-2023]